MEIQQKTSEIIDLNDLEVREVLEFTPEHYRAELAQEFSQKEVIRAPDAVTLDKEPKLFILDGFTEGAIKNILTISRGNIVRLFKVTLDSIDLISYSELANDEAKETIQGQNFKFYSMKAFQNIHDCSVQLIPRESNLSILLTFDQKTGGLLKDEVCKFSEKTDFYHVRELEICDPRNPSGGSFALLITNMMRRTPQGSSKTVELADFVQFRKGKIRRWGLFDGMDENADSLAKEHLTAARAKLRPQHKRVFDFGSTPLFKAQSYSKSHTNLVLFTSNYFGLLVYQLVDLQNKKVLKYRSISLLEILGAERTEKRLQELLQDSFDPQEEISSKFKGFVYLQSDRAFVMKFSIKGFDFVAKIDNIFTSPLQPRIQKLQEYPSQDNMLERFGEGRIFCYKSTTDLKLQDKLTRPLAWLDPETFEEKVFKGLDKHPKSVSISYVSPMNSDYFRAKLSDSSILIVNALSAFIYDFEEGRLISEQRQNLGRFTRSSYKSVGPLYVSNYNRWFHIMKTEKNEEGVEVVKKISSANIDSLFDNIDYKSFGTGFSPFAFLKLSNGNYLYIGAKIFNREAEEGEDQRQRSKVHLVGVEFNSQTFELVKVSKNDIDFSAYDPKIHIHKILMCSGMLVLGGILRDDPVSGGTMDGSDQSKLILMNSDLKIADYDKSSALVEGNDIKVVSANRVISVHLENKLRLHEVNQIEGKLVHLKTVALFGASRISNVTKWEHPSPLFMLVEKQGENKEGQKIHETLLLKLDSNLDLSYVCKSPGFELDNSIYPLKGSRFAYHLKSGRTSNRVYLIDLEDKSIKLAFNPSDRYEAPRYNRDDASGKVHIWVMGHEEIRKVCLSE